MDGMVRLLDDGVGQVLQALDRLGLREETVVVFCADQGDFMASTVWLAGEVHFLIALHGEFDRCCAHAFGPARIRYPAFDAGIGTTFGDCGPATGCCLLRIRCPRSALYDGRSSPNAKALRVAGADAFPPAVARGRGEAEDGADPGLVVRSRPDG